MHSQSHVSHSYYSFSHFVSIHLAEVLIYIYFLKVWKFNKYFGLPACSQISFQSGMGKKWFFKDGGKYCCNCLLCLTYLINSVLLIIDIIPYICSSGSFFGSDTYYHACCWSSPWSHNFIHFKYAITQGGVLCCIWGTRCQHSQWYG